MHTKRVKLANRLSVVLTIVDAGTVDMGLNVDTMVSADIKEKANVENSRLEQEKGFLSMTEAKKKEMYAKEYSRWLEWHRTYFSRYESHLKIPLKERWEILEHFKCIFDIMKKCGVCRFEGEEPMSNVTDFLLKIKTKGDPSSLDDILISNHDSCWTDVMFERTAEEIEAAARRNAQMEVETAEWKEKRDAEEAEKRRKEEEEWKARQEAEEAHRIKCKQDVADFQAQLEAKRKAMQVWSENVMTSLDDMRKGIRHWYADDNVTASELAAVKKYVFTLFAFTDAQNHGMTGLSLYAQNEARAVAHEELLEAFGLYNSEYAKEITKSYDFSDDYDCNTQTYKHLPEDTVVNLLGFALLEARKKENEKHD